MRHVVTGDDERAVLVGEADSGAAALVVVDEQRADAVVLDVRMPLAEGLRTIASLREHHPRLGIVVCSFDLDAATVQRVLDHGADAFLAKPVRRTDLYLALERLSSGDRGGEDPLGPAPAPPSAVTATL